MLNLQEGDNLTVYSVDEQHVVLVDDNGVKHTLDQPGVYFAEVAWTVGDVQTEVKCTAAEARAFLSRNESQLREVLVTRGFNAIHDMAIMDDMPLVEDGDFDDPDEETTDA